MAFHRDDNHPESLGVVDHSLAVHRGNRSEADRMVAIVEDIQNNVHVVVVADSHHDIDLVVGVAVAGRAADPVVPELVGRVHCSDAVDLKI